MLQFLLHPGATVLGDAAKGTALQEAGLPLGAAPERWNLERPEAVRRVHAAHAAAGARWLTANTFGGFRPRLALAGLEGRLAEINQAAVLLAREGGPGLPVLGSLGPTAINGPLAWEKAYAEQAEALAAAGVNGLLVETICSVVEGAAAVRAGAASGAGPVWATFTPGEDGNLLDGSTPEQAAEALTRAGAAVVGVNCGNGPESLLGAARRLVRAGLAPVLAAPNAGLPRLENGLATYTLTPDAFAGSAIHFEESGVSLLAGCCGTTAAHLRAAGKALAARSPSTAVPTE